jgi:hypothetical protein
MSRAISSRMTGYLLAGILGPAPGVPGTYHAYYSTYSSCE